MSAKKTNRLIKKLQEATYRFLHTGIIHLSTDDGKTYKLYRFFGKTLNKKTFKDYNKPFFYLKVNRESDYSLQCIQTWINVIKKIDADYCIVCDNRMLEYKVLRQCKFRDKNVKIIPSMKLNKVIKNLYSGNWKFATRAHLTPFYHAKNNGITKFWQIDADDTSILLKPSKIANVLLEVQKLSYEKKLAAVSLDMWYSKTGGRHWSFGIAYFDTEHCDFINEFENEKTSNWMKYYTDYQPMNADWYITYLRQYKHFSIETFYIDNCIFIHWGSFIINPNSAWIVFYKNGYISNFVFKYIYSNDKLAKIRICEDSIKIDNEFDINEAKRIMENNICSIRYLGDGLRELNLIPTDFANNNTTGDW